MTRERFRLAAVILNLAFQIIGGVFLFWLAPQNIFADISSDALARLCLRLAVYSNAGMALVTILILFTTHEARWLRWLAAGGALYNILAGIDGLRAGLGISGVTMVEPVFGPAFAHMVLFLLLIIAALLPVKKL